MAGLDTPGVSYGLHSLVPVLTGLADGGLFYLRGSNGKAILGVVRETI